MRIPTKISYFVTGAATLALLAGCSGGSGITTPATGGGVTQQSASRSLPSSKHFTSHSVLRPGIQLRVGNAKPFVPSGDMKKTPAGNTIAVSDAANNVVDIFDASGNQTGQLTGFSEPQGMASDIKGDLYVADTANSRIAVYAAGFKGSAKSIADPGQFPAGVDSFSNGKYLGVTNIISTSGGQGSVSIYKGTTLQSTISSPNLTEAFFCAFDATGNLFVDGFDANFVPTVGEIANATSGGTTYTTLTTTNPISFPGGVQVTTSGQIVVDDQSAFAVYTYNPPSGGSLGTPVSVTPLTGASDPVTIAFTKDMSSLYTADAGLGQSQQFAYPAGGAPTSTINVGGQPIGVAVIPTQYPKVTK